jgi:putative lipase involved disintegration of autophagic bodies
MDDDKRTGDQPVPDDLENYLNEAQRAQLRKIEGFGWNLKFIRRTVFQKKVVVVMNTDGSSIGTLEEDGTLNLEPDIDSRD